MISPLLANVYRHEVLDAWFARDVLPRMKGRAALFRYADDAAIIFAREDDARRVLDVLPKRFGKYGLQLHPEKTRLIEFRRPDRRRPSLSVGSTPSGTFNLLGFTHYWAISRNGHWVVKQKTAKDRFKRGLQRIAEWCRKHRHAPLSDQRDALERKLRGHFGYFGIIGNLRALRNFRHQVAKVWRYWLGRRSQRARVSWERMQRIVERYPLPEPHIRPRPARA